MHTLPKTEIEALSAHLRVADREVSGDRPREGRFGVVALALLSLAAAIAVEATHGTTVPDPLSDSIALTAP